MMMGVVQFRLFVMWQSHEVTRVFQHVRRLFVCPVVIVGDGQSQDAGDIAAGEESSVADGKHTAQSGQ